MGASSTAGANSRANGRMGSGFPRSRDDRVSRQRTRVYAYPTTPGATTKTNDGFFRAFLECVGNVYIDQVDLTRNSSAIPVLQYPHDGHEYESGAYCLSPSSNPALIASCTIRSCVTLPC